VTTLVVRKGFIKLAVQNGAEIVPAFVFGEKWLYRVKAISPAVKQWFMQKLKMPMIIFWGRYFSWMPFHDEERAFLTVVFGAPISVQQQEEPSDEYIDQVWDQYEAQIQHIYKVRGEAWRSGDGDGRRAAQAAICGHRFPSSHVWLLCSLLLCLLSYDFSDVQGQVRLHGGRDART